LRWPAAIVGFCLCCLASSSCITFIFPVYVPTFLQTRISTISLSLTSITFTTISLFTTSLRRLGLGRFTRLHTRLPAYHCQYYHHHHPLPPATPSRKHESQSRVPWPNINMSSSEDDKPLVKGSFTTCINHMHARVLSGVTQSFAGWPPQLSRCFD